MSSDDANTNYDTNTSYDDSGDSSDQSTSNSPATRPSSPARSSSQHKPHKDNHLGLKIFFALVLVFTIVYTIAAIKTSIHMAFNTIIWIGSIILLIFLGFKIKEAEKHHAKSQARSEDDYM